MMDRLANDQLLITMKGGEGGALWGFYVDVSAVRTTEYISFSYKRHGNKHTRAQLIGSSIIGFSRVKRPVDMLVVIRNWFLGNVYFGRCGVRLLRIRMYI